MQKENLTDTNTSSSSAASSTSSSSTSSTEKQYMIQYRFYQNELPVVGDKVVFEYCQLEETLVRIKLLEYLDFPASILLSELTRKKTVSSYQQLCPVGQIAVAEVLSIGDNHGTPYIFCSIKSLSPKDISSYMEYYLKSKRLLGFIKKLSHFTSNDVAELCKNICWPLYQQTPTEQHPLDNINHPDKIKLIKSTSNNDDDNETDVGGNDTEIAVATTEVATTAIAETVEVAP
jgi:translation initiation factor 2 alpha subunit (eIF-2alpha)